MEKIKQLKTERKPQEYLEDEEVRKLLHGFDKSYFSECRDAAITTLLLDTGMRLGECLLLQDTAVDFYERTIVIPGDTTKGRKTRTVFFSIKTAQVLRQWLRYRDRYAETMQYVGITAQPLEDRWGVDGSGYKDRKTLMAVINDWGWENVRKEVLYKATTASQAGSLERMMIAKYNTLWPFGYNRQDGGFVDVHTINEKAYPVKQIDPDTAEMVKMWRTAAWAEKYGKGKKRQKLSRHRICDCCNGVKYRKHHGGWAWEKATWEEYKDYYLYAEVPSFPVTIYFS